MNRTFGSKMQLFEVRVIIVEHPFFGQSMSRLSAMILQWRKRSRISFQPPNPDILRPGSIRVPPSPWCCQFF